MSGQFFGQTDSNPRDRPPEFEPVKFTIVRICLGLVTRSVDVKIKIENFVHESNSAFKKRKTDGTSERGTLFDGDGDILRFVRVFDEGGVRLGFDFDVTNYV